MKPIVYTTALLLITGIAHAYDLPLVSTTGGSAVQSGGVYTLQSSTGQPFAQQSTDQSTELYSGFWGRGSGESGTLSITPDLIERTAPSGGSATRANIDISTMEGTAITWTASTDQPWVLLSKTTGQTPDFVEINFDTTGLLPQPLPHTATVTIKAAGQSASTTINLTILSNEAYWMIW